MSQPPSTRSCRLVCGSRLVASQIQGLGIESRCLGFTICSPQLESRVDCLSSLSCLKLGLTYRRCCHTVVCNAPKLEYFIKVVPLEYVDTCHPFLTALPCQSDFPHLLFSHLAFIINSETGCRPARLVPHQLLFHFALCCSSPKPES